MAAHRTNSDPERITLPELIVVPFGAATKTCECGRKLWLVKHGTSWVPVTCTEQQLQTKAGPIRVPGCSPPYDGRDGLGFNHFIDCPKRRKFGKRAAPEATTGSATSAAPEPVQDGSGPDMARRIIAAEQLAERHHLKCTGGPSVPEYCTAPGIVVFLLSEKLFAVPCSVHADTVQIALKRSGRPAREWRVTAIDDYLNGPRASQFVAKAHAVRESNHRNGVHVPDKGPLIP